MNKEGKVQNKLIKQLELDGWYVIKLIQTNKTGIPDIVAFKGKDFKFIEVKTSKGIVSKIQEYRIKELNNKGFDAFVFREGDEIKTNN